MKDKKSYSAIQKQNIETKYLIRTVFGSLSSVWSHDKNILVQLWSVLKKILSIINLLHTQVDGQR